MPTPLRLLLLEDNRFDAELTIATLEEAGYECRWERVEIEAEYVACLARAETDYDLILADYSLPAFDGLTALEQYVDLDLDLPFILVSGTLGEEIAIESLKAGATDYVLKDRISRLPSVVERALREREEKRERRRAQEMVRESEARWRSLTENSPDRVTTLDRDLRIEFANRPPPGITVDELIGTRLYEWVADEKRSEIKSILEKALEGGEPASFSYTYQTPDSRSVSYESQVAPRIVGSEVIGLTVSSRDVTARVEAQRKAHAQHQFLLTVIESLTHPFYVINVSDCTIELANSAAGIGEGSEPITCFELTHGRDQRCAGDEHPCPLAEVVATGRPATAEHIHYDAQGDAHVTEVHCHPILDQHGNVVQMIEYALDVTERKQTEQEREALMLEVAAHAQRVQRIIDTVPEGVILMDSEGEVLLVNPMGERDLAALAGAGVGDMLVQLGDRPLAELLAPPPKGLWHQIEMEGPPQRFFELIARPLESGEGQVLVIRDVTQEREIQHRVQQQDRLAAVGQVAAGIAHDFNNIMAVISLYAGMARRTPQVPEKVRDRMETIRRQSHRASALIEQILDFSRRAVLERRPMDLLIFVREQVKLLERTLPESVTIELDFAAVEYVVSADPTRLQQATMNLAVNARDAMAAKGGGELRINLDRIRMDEPAGGRLRELLRQSAAAEADAQSTEPETTEWVRLVVSDSGEGIPADVLPRIYDPFFTTKAPGKGTGLGLAQVHGIVKQHDGEIDVTSQVGQGTTFSIYLPALPVEQAGDPEEERLPLMMGKGETILVVEDNETAREALASSLQSLNYRTLEAANGLEALVLLDQGVGHIDLVVSDVVMPEMGGEALRDEMRQRRPALKVLLLTGHPINGEYRALSAQPKPRSLEHLSHMVWRALGRA